MSNKDLDEFYEEIDDGWKTREEISNLLLEVSNDKLKQILLLVKRVAR